MQVHWSMVVMNTAINWNMPHTGTEALTSICSGTRTSQLKGLEESIITCGTYKPATSDKPPRHRRQRDHADGATSISQDSRICLRRLLIPRADTHSDRRHCDTPQMRYFPLGGTSWSLPSGTSLFNLYVALSRSSGKSTIRMLRDFDERIFHGMP